MPITRSQLAGLMVAVGLTLPGTAFAQQWFDAGYLRITGMLLLDDSLEVTLEGTVNCNRIFRLRTSEPNYDVKAAALLSAYYANHEVSVYYSGDLNACSTPLHWFKVRR